MALLENWRNLAYGNGLDDKQKENLWNGYFTIEKGIYEQILSNPTEVITGTVKELAEKYNTEILIMTGFLDGINESLKDYQNLNNMSDLTATNCGGGCGCNDSSNCSWIIIIILLLCCCGGNGFGGNGCGNGSDWSCIIWIIIILCLCGGNGFC